MMLYTAPEEGYHGYDYYTLSFFVVALWLFY